MLKHKRKDIKLRKGFRSIEITNKLLHTLNSNQLLPKYSFFFNQAIKSKTQIINICIITGRSRSVSRITKVSRLQVKKLYKFYKISGLKNASW